MGYSVVSCENPCLMMLEDWVQALWKIIEVQNNKTHFINGHQDLVTACDVYKTKQMITL